MTNFEVLNDLLNFKLSKEEEEQLYIDISKKIDELILQDSLLAHRINELKKDEIIYRKSITAIYKYVLDTILCSKCDGNFDNCVKINRGSILGLVYDEALKKYEIGTFFCQHYSHIINSYNSNLIVSTLTVDTIMQNRNDYMKMVKSSLSKYKEYLNAQKIILDYLSFFKNKKQHKGIIFSNKISSSSMVYTFCAVIHKLITETDYKVSYIDFSSAYLKKLNSQYDDDKEEANSFIDNAMQSQVLFINNFDVVPQYVNNFNEKYWLKLLNKRNKNDFITFANLSTDISMQSLVNKKNYYLDKKNEISLSLSSIFEVYNFEAPQIILK